MFFYEFVKVVNSMKIRDIFGILVENFENFSGNVCNFQTIFETFLQFLENFKKVKDMENTRLISDLQGLSSSLSRNESAPEYKPKLKFSKLFVLNIYSIFFHELF